MSKLSQAQKEQLKQCVIDCSIRRLTAVETQQYIHDKMNGLDITIDYLRHLKSDLKKDSEKELNLYQKDRFAYLNSIFFDRVEELKFMQKTLHEVIENEGDSETKIKAVNQLQSITSQLARYYGQLPQIASFGATAGLFPSLSVVGQENNNNGKEDKDSWFCIHCDKTHFENNECRQYIFGDKDEWCERCNRVHDYDKEQCPLGGKWSMDS
jgi:hypothetical protein